MLRKFKEAASLAISVTTGRKPSFGPKEKSLTNIIPGFGYALMDVFENEFVDMASISKSGAQIAEEQASPFASPAKSRGKRDKSVSKEDHRRQRREQRRKEQEERDRRELEPPTQHAFVKIKTSIGKHPVIDYLSTFTNDEITEGKKHLLNHWRRDPSKPVLQPNRSASPGKRGAGEAGSFKIDVNEAKRGLAATQQQDAAEPRASAGGGEASSEVLLPRVRAPGGIWLAQTDFPHAFQHVIVYRNPKKYSHLEVHQDIWENGAEPYVSNLSEVYIKLELDPEAIERVRQDERVYARIGIQGAQGGQADETARQQPGGEEAKGDEGALTGRAGEDGQLLPGERPKAPAEHDDILLACAPYPSNKAVDVLPRYLTRVRQVNCSTEEDLIDQTYSSYFGGVQYRIRGEMAKQSCIWLKPEFNCPQGATLWVASQLRKVSFVPRSEYLREQ
jgi:hypothetical protein